jgi:carboxypeptidase Q
VHTYIILSLPVIAELPGTSTPQEMVLISAHSDSWDVGTGAMDDGGSCIIVWETLNLLRSLNLIPRRTIRTVLFTNEVLRAM